MCVVGKVYCNSISYYPSGYLSSHRISIPNLDKCIQLGYLPSTWITSPHQPHWLVHAPDNQCSISSTANLCCAYAMHLALNCKCQISDPSLRSGSHTDRHNFRQIIIVTSHASQQIPSSEMDSMSCCLQKARQPQVWTGVQFTSTVQVLSYHWIWVMGTSSQRVLESWLRC